MNWLSIALLIGAVFSFAMFARRCSIGTRSCLYGYHTFWLHGWFVARGWYELHGWREVRIGTREVVTGVPRLNGPGVSQTVRVPEYTSLADPRLWLAFFLHDIGYFGKPNMDGPEGETHPKVGAKIMFHLFGPTWYNMCLYHSRFYAKRFRTPPSALCYADKLAITYYPEWLMVRLVTWTGEVNEYMKDAQRMNPGAHDNLQPGEVLKWFRGVKDYVRKWVAEHKDGREDTWTTEANRHDPRGTVNAEGVWK